MPRARARNVDQLSTAEVFDGMRADYQAAKSSRFRRRRTGYASQGSGADYHYASEADYLKLIELARDMDRNDCIVGQLVDRAVDNILQDGFSLDPQTGDKGLDSDLWERWDQWATTPDQCDLAGELCWADMERLALRHMLVDGDMVALAVQDGPLQLIESHRVRTPRGTKQNVVHGVKLDDRRKRVEYWITKDDVSPLRAVNRVSEIEQYFVRDTAGYRQVFHVLNPKRVSQTRGVTAFAPIFDQLGMFEDVNFAKLVQQQVVSCFAVFREIDPNAPAGFGDTAHGARTSETISDGSTRTLEGIAPGMEITGRPGEKLQGFSPAVPNAEFFQHVRLILTLVGINLGMPLVLVLLDASETNFSGFRGAVDQARLGFRRNQQALRRRFHSPVYEWKVRQWLAEDAGLRKAAARSEVSILRHRFNCPTWPYIEPLKDAGADLIRVRNGLISPRRLHAERGRDWEELAAEIVADNSLAIRAAKLEAQQLNSDIDDGQPVHWRELLSLPTPDGVQLALAADGGAQSGSNEGTRQEVASG